MKPSENFSEEVAPVASVGSHGENSRNVLDHHVPRSKLAYHSEHLSPKRSLGMVESGPSSGVRDSLAGEAAGDDVDGLGVSPDGSDVVVDPDSWEPEREELASERVDLAEPAVLESGEVEPVGEESASIE